MTIQEFEKLTGTYPTMDHYRAIEAAYMEWNGDKQSFCKAYAANRDGMAEKIARTHSIAMAKAQAGEANAAKRREAEMIAKIERLERALEREQEWKAWTDEKEVGDAEYRQLAASGREMSDDEAREMICEEFGFAKEKVQIEHSAKTYEINRHGQLRTVGNRDRVPLYEATDWYYIRFTVFRFEYEAYNGQLNQI